MSLPSSVASQMGTVCSAEVGAIIPDTTYADVDMDTALGNLLHCVKAVKSIFFFILSLCFGSFC